MKPYVTVSYHFIRLLQLSQDQTTGLLEGRPQPQPPAQFSEWQGYCGNGMGIQGKANELACSSLANSLFIGPSRVPKL